MNKAFRVFAYLHLTMTALGVMATTYGLIASIGAGQFFWVSVPTMIAIWQRSRVEWLKVTLPGGVRV